jgi:putative transposase
MTNHVHLIAVPGSTQSLALTLAQTHSQYSLEMNRLQGRVGHLWQNRFFSCTLDPSHLLTAIRYVDLNPVRAGMMARAVDWHWSSARAHTSAHGRDELLEWPWISWLKEARLGHWDSADWVTSLSMAVPAGDLERVRRATRLGEPLGSDAFVEELEAKAGRRLRVGPQGRPHAEKKAAAADGS